MTRNRRIADKREDAKARRRSEQPSAATRKSEFGHGVSCQSRFEFFALTIAGRGQTRAPSKARPFLTAQAGRPGIDRRAAHFRRSIPGLPARAGKCFLPTMLAMSKAKNSTSHLPRSGPALLLRPGKSFQQNKKSQGLHEEKHQEIHAATHKIFTSLHAHRNNAGGVADGAAGIGGGDEFFGAAPVSANR